MSYQGAATVAESRELLGGALEALQQDPDLPDDVMNVAQNIAQAVGALFEAERASSDVDGKASVKHAMGSLSQTMALLQDVDGQHSGVDTATAALASVMSKLYPLAQAPSLRPGSSAGSQPAPAAESIPATAAVPSESTGAVGPTSLQPGERESLEANVGATTESNFFVGFSGDIGDGGVFVATYLTLPIGALCEVLVTLPGGFAKTIPGGRARRGLGGFALDAHARAGADRKFGPHGGELRPAREARADGPRSTGGRRSRIRPRAPAPRRDPGVRGHADLLRPPHVDGDRPRRVRRHRDDDGEDQRHQHRSHDGEARTRPDRRRRLRRAERCAAYSPVDDGTNASWLGNWMWSLGIATAGGTANIQRNIIAERGLGLPRERAANAGAGRER